MAPVNSWNAHTVERPAACTQLHPQQPPTPYRRNPKSCGCWPPQLHLDSCENAQSWKGPLCICSSPSQGRGFSRTREQLATLPRLKFFQLIQIQQHGPALMGRNMKLAILKLPCTTSLFSSIEQPWDINYCFFQSEFLFCPTFCSGTESGWESGWESFANMHTLSHTLLHVLMLAAIHVHVHFKRQCDIRRRSWPLK